MAKKKIVPAVPMSTDQAANYRKDKAVERAGRGFTTFTRTSVREEVMGTTPGENRLQQVQRRSQVKRPR